MLIPDFFLKVHLQGAFAVFWSKLHKNNRWTNEVLRYKFSKRFKIKVCKLLNRAFPSCCEPHYDSMATSKTFLFDLTCR